MPEQPISEKPIEIKMQNGEGISDSVFYYPEGKGSWPGVLYLTDIGGIRAANRDSAARLAQQGYAVLMPNIFYRTSRTPLQPTLGTLDEEGRKKRMAELIYPLPQDAMERDASTYIDFLTSQKETAAGKIGIAGYCFSGKMAMYAAAGRADKVAAAASFHGGGLFTNDLASPHLALPRIKARLYFGHAVQDRSMPQEAIAQFEQALAQWGGKYESETYEGAFHSWTSTDSPVYNQSQAERAFQKLTQLLRESLSS
jgi:carboxymethylenebutenolidase